ncbi:hypothetical protein V6N13_017355 [Hibiscus sabdariffa]|uniref:Uncharacterized protein n=1 Tax=Hibiscus sabdariffa TaxID=183260 RepID=A0ABR2CZR4_9ROSI
MYTYKNRIERDHWELWCLLVCVSNNEVEDKLYCYSYSFARLEEWLLEKHRGVGFDAVRLREYCSECSMNSISDGVER